MKEISIIIAESSDIMLNGISAMLNGRPEIAVSGKANGFNALYQLLETKTTEIVLLGPIFSQKYPAELKEEMKKTFPDIKLVEMDLKDEQDSVIEKIKKVATI
ncbi:MAG: hypothetical protein V2I46_05820 [Bacteroides sp.]|jgi:DNA-binding NarL/FixJ family response regulator|nr:hypothetical protein [Bacteroides sp.]